MLSCSSILGNLGLATVLATPHSISFAKPPSTGLVLTKSGELSKDFSGGSSVPFSDLYVHVARFSFFCRNSIQSHAASGFLLFARRISESPAIVVLHPAGPSGSGAVLHLASVLGFSDWMVPAGHEPAMSRATLPCSKATRPS